MCRAFCVLFTAFPLADLLRSPEGGEPGRMGGESNQQPLEGESRLDGHELWIVLQFLGYDCDNWWTATVRASCKAQEMCEPLNGVVQIWVAPTLIGYFH